jgi:adenylate kinase
MRLVFIGPPGSGKGTQARLLKERLGLVPIGTGDILREAVRDGGALGKKVAPFLQSGQLAPDDLVNELVADLFRRDNHPTKFVLDGYPRTLAQAASFEAVLRQTQLDLKKVLKFTLPDEEVVRRLGGRLVEQGRDDDGAETVRKRLAIYQDGIKDLVEYYRRQGLLRIIDATADVEAVYQNIAALCAA